MAMIKPMEIAFDDIKLAVNTRTVLAIVPPRGCEAI